MTVTLRVWDVSDAEWYAEIAANDEMIQRFTSESPVVTAAEVKAAITQLLEGGGDAAGFLIADADTAARLGNIALDYDDGIGDVSYWLAPEARGRGVATAALRLICAWAFDTLGLKELRLWAHVDNLASQAVAERAGFRRDPEHDQQKLIKGQTWDTVAYSLVAQAHS